MDFHHYIGIDIAKDTLDWAAINQQGVLLRIHTPNTVIGIQTALRQLKELPGWGKPCSVWSTQEFTMRICWIFYTNRIYLFG
jgi:transposase